MFFTESRLCYHKTQTGRVLHKQLTFWNLLLHAQKISRGTIGFLVTSSTKDIFPTSFSVWKKSWLFHFRMMEATLFLGSFSVAIISYCPPQIWALINWSCADPSQGVDTSQRTHQETWKNNPELEFKFHSKSLNTYVSASMCCTCSSIYAFCHKTCTLYLHSNPDNSFLILNPSSTTTTTTKEEPGIRQSVSQFVRIIQNSSSSCII